MASTGQSQKPPAFGAVNSSGAWRAWNLSTRAIVADKIHSPPLSFVRTIRQAVNTTASREPCITAPAPPVIVSESNTYFAGLRCPIRFARAAAADALSTPPSSRNGPAAFHVPDSFGAERLASIEASM